MACLSNQAVQTIHLLTSVRDSIHLSITPILRIFYSSVSDYRLSTTYRLEETEVGIIEWIGSNNTLSSLAYPSSFMLHISFLMDNKATLNYSQPMKQ